MQGHAMSGLLDGKTALVTGAGSGIGAGIARGMADAGAMAKNDAKSAGARYFIIFMLLPDVVSTIIPDGGIDSKSIKFLT